MAIYTATFSAVAVTAAQDVFEITAHSTSKIRIRECRLQQYTEFADAQAEILSVTVIRGFTTSGSGGTSVTPNNVSGHTGGPTPLCAVEANNTTLAQNGTGVTLVADAWNVAAGWSLRDILKPRLGNWDGESEELIVNKGQRLVVRITAPADSMTCNGTLVFEEIGQNPA